MRSLTVSCLVEDDRPKTRWYHGIPTEPSSSWTMIVVGVSSVGTVSGVVVGFSAPASSAAPDCGAPDWASTDEAGGCGARLAILATVSSESRRSGHGGHGKGARS